VSVEAFGLSMVGLGAEGASHLRPRPSWSMPVFEEFGELVHYQCITNGTCGESGKEQLMTICI